MTSNSEPPCAEIAEMAVITHLFGNPHQFFPRFRGEGMSAESFWKHRRLFQNINRFWDENGEIEITAFIQDISTRGEYDALGGGMLTEALMFPTYGSFGWPKWTQQLKDMEALRIAYFLHSRESDYETGEDAEKAVTEALEAIQKARSVPARLASAADSVEAFKAHFLELAKNETIPGLSTGIPILDDASGGMRAGELWVICGKTSRGKSVLMLQLAAEVLTDGKRALIFSLEMGKAEVTGRMIACTGFLDYTNITQPRKADSRSMDLILGQLKRVKELDYWVDDSAGQTIDHITSTARLMKETEGHIDIIVVDYLQYITPDPNRRDSREQEVARISRGLKQLAKEMNCPLITGAQLNEDGQTRESKAIQMDADSLLFIADDGVLVGKLRNGKRDDVLPIFLDGRVQRFRQRA